MNHWTKKTAWAIALCCAAGGVHASSWGDNLRQQASQLGTSGTESKASTSALGGVLGNSSANSSLLSSLGVPAAGTASNAAGVITYCMKNNYIDANKKKAEQVKDQLLGKVGLKKKEEPKDEGYLSGLAGKITGKDGQSFSMDKLKGDVKEKACDFVLDNATSLL